MFICSFFCRCCFCWFTTFEKFSITNVVNFCTLHIHYKLDYFTMPSIFSNAFFLYPFWNKSEFVIHFCLFAGTCPSNWNEISAIWSFNKIANSTHFSCIYAYFFFSLAWAHFNPLFKFTKQINSIVIVELFPFAYRTLERNTFSLPHVTTLFN